MVVGFKDSFKMLGIIIMSACAVFVCTLFLNYNMDLKQIENLILPQQQGLFEALVMTGTVVSAVSGGCLLLTSVVMLCFYIKHYIDTHRRELGILKALGYSDLQISLGFWVFGLSVFLGTGLGYLGAHGIMPRFYEVQGEDKLLPEVTMHFHSELLFYLVLLPTIAFSLLSILYSCWKMGTPVLELLKGKSVEKCKLTNKNSDLPFLKELRRNTLRQRKSLVFFIGFATFCYSAMMQMSCSMDELASVMMSVMVMMIGIVLACVTLFLAITTVVKANSKTIAMMKVFGYSMKECSGAILGGYRLVAYIGFIIGTVYQYVLLKTVVSVVFREIENVPEYGFDVPVCVITLISFIIFYELIMYGYSVRLGKVSVKEIMLEAE